MGKEILDVLDLARAELHVFTAAGVSLCFEFVLEPSLIIQECFSYCWVVLTQSQELFCFSHCPTSTQNQLVRDIHLLVTEQVVC